MRKKSMFDRNAEKILAKSTIKTTQKDDSKKKEDDAKDKDDKSKTEDDASDKGDSKDDKSKDDSKDKDKQPDNEDSDSKKDDAKDGDAKDGKVKDGKDDNKSEPDKNPDPAPAPAKAYTGTGNVTGMNQTTRTTVNCNGPVEQTTVNNYFGGSLHQFANETCGPAVAEYKLLNLSEDDQKTLMDLSELRDFSRATEERKVKDAFKHVMRATAERCPDEFNKLLRDLITDALERDPSLYDYINGIHTERHKVERRFRPFRAEVAHELWDEATARAYIVEQKADLPGRLAESARDEDFGSWVFVEVDGTTGQVRRELSEEEAAPYKKKQVTAEPKKKPRGNKKPEDKGEA